MTLPDNIDPLFTFDLVNLNSDQLSLVLNHLNGFTSRSKERNVILRNVIYFLTTKYWPLDPHRLKGLNFGSNFSEVILGQS